MTTRPLTRLAGPDPQPAIKLRDPAGVVAAVPYMLGFVPTRSLVVVGVEDDESVGPTLRCDLSLDSSPEQWAATWDYVTQVMSRNGCTRLLVVLYLDVDPENLSPDATEVILDLLLDRRDFPDTAAFVNRTDVVDLPDVLEVLLVGPSRFRSLLCGDDDCCPVTGTALSAAKTHAVAASFVLAGRNPAADRDGVEPEDRTVTPAQRRKALAAADSTRTRGLTPAAALRLFDRWTDSLPGGPSPSLTGRVVASWTASPMLRDACLGVFLPGGTATGRALLSADNNEDAPGSSLGAILTDSNCAGASRAGGPVLRRMAAMSSGQDRATVLASHAWLAWVAGDGTAGGVLAERALDVDPQQSLAQLVLQCLNYGLGAPWTTSER